MAGSLRAREEAQAALEEAPRSGALPPIETEIEVPQRLRMPLAATPPADAIPAGSPAPVRRPCESSCTIVQVEKATVASAPAGGIPGAGRTTSPSSRRSRAWRAGGFLSYSMVRSLLKGVRGRSARLEGAYQSPLRSVNASPGVRMSLSPVLAGILTPLPPGARPGRPGGEGSALPDPDGVSRPR